MAGSFPKLVLASASPRRRALLQERGFHFEVAPAQITEVSPRYFSPGETVLFNARAKCRAVALERYDEVVVGVDTEVALGGEVLGKPCDMDAAMEMLGRLKGREHHVYSGLWIARLGSGEEHGAVTVTCVHCRPLPEAAMRAYLERIGPLDKAGSYAAQEDEGEFIDHVDGSFTNVVGLPMETLERLLGLFSTPARAQTRPA